MFPNFIELLVENMAYKVRVKSVEDYIGKDCVTVKKMSCPKKAVIGFPSDVPPRSASNAEDGLDGGKRDKHQEIKVGLIKLFLIKWRQLCQKT